MNIPTRSIRRSAIACALVQLLTACGGSQDAPTPAPHNTHQNAPPPQQPQQPQQPPQPQPQGGTLMTPAIASPWAAAYTAAYNLPAPEVKVKSNAKAKAKAKPSMASGPRATFQVSSTGAIHGFVVYFDSQSSLQRRLRFSGKLNPGESLASLPLMTPSRQQNGSIMLKFTETHQASQEVAITFSIPNEPQLVFTGHPIGAVELTEGRLAQNGSPFSLAVRDQGMYTLTKIELTPGPVEREVVERSMSKRKSVGPYIVKRSVDKRGSDEESWELNAVTEFSTDPKSPAGYLVSLHSTLTPTRTPGLYKAQCTLTKETTPPAQATCEGRAFVWQDHPGSGPATLVLTGAGGCPDLFIMGQLPSAPAKK